MVSDSDSSSCFLVPLCFIIHPQSSPLETSSSSATNCDELLADAEESKCLLVLTLEADFHLHSPASPVSPRTMPIRLVNTITSFIQSIHITRTITVYHQFWTCIWLREQPPSRSLTDRVQYFVYSHSRARYMPCLLKHRWKMCLLPSLWFHFSV